MSQAAEQVSPIVDADELRACTNIQQNAALERYLRKHGIPYFPSAAGPWTTVQLLNEAGRAKIGGPAANQQQEYDIP